MNKISKALVMTGMALVAGATLGAGSASAAPATAAAPKPTAAQAPSHDKVVGYYRSATSCHIAGKLGERRDRWDDHDCLRVRSGSRRGWFALSVSWDKHGFPGHNMPGHNMPGHNMPGHNLPSHNAPGHGPSHSTPGHH